jgi:hypothetical protein
MVHQSHNLLGKSCFASEEHARFRMSLEDHMLPLAKLDWLIDTVSSWDGIQVEW